MRKAQLFRFLFLLFISCNQANTSRRWSKFHPQEISSQHSNHGPWGGETRIVWNAIPSKRFYTEELIDFSTKNGWILGDRYRLNSTDSSSIISSDDELCAEILQTRILPGWRNKDVDIYVFRTGSIAVKPGEATETYLNGFVMLNTNGTELEVYQVWGE